MTQSLLLALGLGLAGVQTDERPPTDRRTGLVVAEGFEQVRTKCTECHSSTLILQTRGRREDWLGLIRWMQATQELDELDAETEAAILDYLSRYYGVERQAFRRRPLAGELLPPPSEPPPSP